MRETSVPGKQISTTGIQDLGEVAILDSMQFRCKERSLPRGRERRKNHRSEDLNICLREGETRRRREKKQRPLRPHCSGRNNMLSELSAIAEVSDIFPAANSYVLIKYLLFGTVLAITGAYDLSRYSNKSRNL